MVEESLHVRGGWLLEVKCKKERKSVLTLLVEMNRLSVFSKSQWKECVDPVSENVKDRKCLKTRIYIDNPCHAVGSKDVGQNWSCGCSCEH